MNSIKDSRTGLAAGLKATGSALCLGIFALVSTASAGDANLTRFGPKIYERERGAPTSDSAEFRAIGGPAELVLQDDGIINARIKVNGVDVVGPEDFRGDGEIVVPLDLYPENTIEVSVRGKPGGTLGVRVTQFTESDVNVRAKMYFGLNTSDFFEQLAFYDTLGFAPDIYPAGPEQCKSFAQSLGFPDNYLIRVALTSLDGAPPWIDTVGFREEFYRDDPPYANLNHIGMAYATYATTDLNGDYDYLVDQGIEFVSPPTTAPNGERFVFLKDQDGTFFKLIEESGNTTAGPDLVRLVNTNMNVADLERSREFYRLLGFTQEEDGSQYGAGPFAEAHGFDDPIEFEGVDVSLPGDPAPLGDNEATLQLRQWKTPFNFAPPYSPPVNHLGIDRIAFYVDDLNATIEEMNRLGFEQAWPIGGGATVGSVGIVFFFDPDGIKVEFWGPVSEPNPNSSCI
ncbi:VOC family protein [Haliea sp. E1-2-M8]|uniref:VOC family protein n=1 Tax=Haliea sp. E1-2-M8 TaxID=3064706 RepID=UPI00271F55B3|nr:VOC family protein [Haliea sp. E1-2-M8]MDO8861540.1 VOC family protein [Haliea sp. E1-2-M8]